MYRLNKQASISEYEYSATQLLPGDYIYVKWWDGGPVFASLAEKANQKWRNVFLALKGTSIRFSFSRIFGHGGLTVAHFRPSLAIGPKQPKHTGYTGQYPCSGLVNQHNGRLYN